MILGFENKHGWRFHVTGHSASGNVNNFGSCSILFMGACWHSFACFARASWQSPDYIHDFGSCHMRCRGTLFSEYRIGAWIILHCITTQYDSSFVLLEFIVQFWIREMTQVHERSNMNCFFFSSICQGGTFFNLSHSLSTAAVASEMFCFWSKHRQMNQIVRTHSIDSTVCIMLFVLSFAAFVDTSSLIFMGIKSVLWANKAFGFSSLVDEVSPSCASAQVPNFSLHSR